MVDGQRLELRCERYVPTFSLPAAKDGITRWEGRRAEKGRGSSREGEGSQPGFARAHSWVTEGRGEESRAEQSNLGGGGAQRWAVWAGEERGSFPPAPTSLKATVGVASSRFGEVGNLRHHSIGDGYQGTEQLAQCCIQHSEQRTERGGTLIAFWLVHLPVQVRNLTFPTG